MKKVRSERTSAIAVGALYVAATVAAVLAMAVQAPGGLAGMASHPAEVFAAAFFELVMAVTVAGVAFMLYPVLKQDTDTPAKQGLALWYVGTRITEGTVFLVGMLGLLSMFALSQAIAGAGAVDVAQLRAVGGVLKTVTDYSWVLGQTVFCVGAAMLYYLLFVSRRVPRWLAVWGLIAVPMMLVAGFLLPLTGDPNSTISTILYAPMGLQEMVLAVWLIVRGFNPSIERKGEHYVR